MRSPDVFRVPEVQSSALAFGARPRSGDWLDDEISGYAKLGFRHVVSLLEANEVRELDLMRQPSLCAAHGIRFHSLPIPDRGVPDDRGTLAALARSLADAIGAGEAVYIHCRAGIGRSGLFTAVLMLHLGGRYESIFPSLSAVRGVHVPDTDEQARWVREYASFVSSMRASEMTSSER